MESFAKESNASQTSEATLSNKIERQASSLQKRQSLISVEHLKLILNSFLVLPKIKRRTIPSRQRKLKQNVSTKMQISKVMDKLWMMMK